MYINSDQAYFELWNILVGTGELPLSRKVVDPPNHFETATPVELPYHAAGKHIVVGEYFFGHQVAVRLLGLQLFEVLLTGLGIGSLLFHCLAWWRNWGHYLICLVAVAAI